MRFNRIYLLLFLLLQVVLFSCKQEEAPDFHFEYFGLEEGRYVIYDVMEIEHDKNLGKHDTVRYQIKTYWADTYVDNEGREGREFHLYRRDSVSGTWMLTDVWYGLYDGIRAELVEENERRVKLVFAPTLSKEWDANAYNMNDELPCYYRAIHGDTTLSGVYLDSTLVVEQQSNNNLIDSVRQYEMYAKHIGMVYKHFRDNTYQIGNTEVYYGNEVYWKYVSHGYE